MTAFKQQISEIVQKAVKDIYEIDFDPLIEHPTQESHGDYSTNAALVLARELNRKPLAVAEEIASAISEQEVPIVQRISTAPPGFINFWLSPESLLKEVGAVTNGYGRSDLGKGGTVVIDYSAPNIAKRFGVGHLRSTVIGQALYNLHKSLGYRVIGDNHLGDWGTQFGVLLRQITNSKFKVESLTVEDLEKLYVEFHQQAAEQPEMMDEARAWFKKLEEGDKQAREIWRSVVEISMEEFERIYELLGVKIDSVYGESFYQGKMADVIKEIREKGLSKKSEGAEIVEFADIPPAILVKSDGATTYFTRDLATIKFRIKEWDPQIFIYEVGADQKLHFEQVFAAARLLGWIKDQKLVHVAHGLIRFPGGKMSTRHGKTVKLEEVLDEAVKRARTLIEQSETARGFSDKEKEKTAKAVGIGAVKYFDLSHQPTSDIIFDWEQMFQLEGNSAPYLQYTYARAASVLEKAGKNETKIKNTEFSAAEQPLLRYFYRFPEVVDDAAKNYSPNLLCNYLFELAQRFNSFYASSPILKSDPDIKDLRLAMTSATAQILKEGLMLLGIETPEHL